MSGGPLGQSPKGNILDGLLRLARGDATGIARFGHTPAAFVRSLAPLIALPLLVAIATIGQGEVRRAITDFLAAIAALLSGPVVSHLLARRWNREDHWLRYATAFNWTQFGMTAALLAVFLILGVALASSGASALSHSLALGIGLGCLTLVGYTFWLHWFIARAGLDITGGRAVLVVLATYAASIAILLVWSPPLMSPG
jgi:predicted Na+-dependent transporter